MTGAISIAVQARARDLKPSTVYARIAEGWSTERALTTPTGRCGVRGSASVSFHAGTNGLTNSAIVHRMKSQGLTLAQALSYPPQKRDPRIRAAADAAGIKYATVYNRLKNGLTLEQAVSSMATCPTCARAIGDTPVADHDHTTKIFRGLICRRCNTVLGLICDSPATLRRLAEYLERGVS